LGFLYYDLVIYKSLALKVFFGYGGAVTGPSISTFKGREYSEIKYTYYVVIGNDIFFVEAFNALEIC